MGFVDQLHIGTIGRVNKLPGGGFTARILSDTDDHKALTCKFFINCLPT